MDMAMDRLAVPYRFIMLSTKLDKGSRMRVRIAHGLSEILHQVERVGAGWGRLTRQVGDV